MDLNIGLENIAKCYFYVYASTDATANVASCSTCLATSILTHEECKPRL